MAGVCEELAAYLRRAQSKTLQLRALGIERALPSAMVATGAMFVSVTWAGTSGPGLPQLAARTMRYSSAARARRRQHCHAQPVLMAINQLLKRMSDFYSPLQSGDLLLCAKHLFVAAMVASGRHKTGRYAGGEEGAKVAQNVAAGVAGVVIPVLWFGMDFKGAASKEVTALQARQQYLTVLATERCKPGADSASRARAYAPER